MDYDRRHLTSNCSAKQLQGADHLIPYNPCSHNPSNPRTPAPRATASYSPLPGGGLIFICFSTSFCSSFNFSASSSISLTRALIASSSYNEWRRYGEELKRNQRRGSACSRTARGPNHARPFPSPHARVIMKRNASYLL